MIKAYFYLPILLLLFRTTIQQCDTTSISTCGVNSCAGYYWDVTTCISCSTDLNTNMSNLVGLPATSLCNCNKPYIWDSTYLFCRVSCDLVTNSNMCGQTYCNNYFWNGGKCVSCESILNAESYAITSAGNTICFCISGYVWDGISMTCINCTAFVNVPTNCGIGQCQNFIWFNGTCIDCSSLDNTVGFVLTQTNNQC